MKDIKALKKKYGDGKGLVVRIDNDCTHVYASLGDEENGSPLFEGEGYRDCEDLWQALFPKAYAEWV